MAQESTCERCGGHVRPTGGRSRNGFGPGPNDAAVAWHPWRETGVCSACGAVHRRVADLPGAVWDFAGTMIDQPDAFDFPAPAGAPAPTAFEFRLELKGRRRAMVPVGRGGAKAGGIPTRGAVVAPNPTPVDGQPLRLRWNMEGEPSDALDGLDYATLALVIAAFLGVTAQTDDPRQGLIACVLLYVVLSWAPTRRALRVLMRDMQGRD
jgi:hypothetical protein